MLLLYIYIIIYAIYIYNNICYCYSTDEDPSLWIESSAIINLCGVSTKLNKYRSDFAHNFQLPVYATLIQYIL